MIHQDYNNLQMSYVWLEYHVNGEKDQCEPLGGEVDDFQWWDFSTSLDVQDHPMGITSHNVKEGSISSRRM